jgi:hypothetical protein
MAFGSSSVTTHLLRGAGGLAVLALAMHAESISIWLALLLLPVALWLFRGCPVCWTVGLFETLAHRFLARHESLDDAPAEHPVDRRRGPCPGC